MSRYSWGQLMTASVMVSLWMCTFINTCTCGTLRGDGATKYIMQRNLWTKYQNIISNHLYCDAVRQTYCDAYLSWAHGVSQDVDRCFFLMGACLDWSFRSLLIIPFISSTSNVIHNPICMAIRSCIPSWSATNLRSLFLFSNVMKLAYSESPSSAQQEYVFIRWTLLSSYDCL